MTLWVRDLAVECCLEATQAATFNCSVPPLGKLRLADVNVQQLSKRQNTLIKDSDQRLRIFDNENVPLMT